jgi:RND family efflux transporter MFP subunit
MHPRTFRMLAATSLLAGALAACTDTSANDARPANDAAPRPVVVERVALSERVPVRTMVGSVRAAVESDLGFRVAGKISERLVKAGDSVVAGQPLFRLDATDLDLQRAQAQAELEAATVNLDTANAREQRQIALRRNGFATDLAVETAQAQTAEGRGRLDRARRALDLASNAASYAVLVADTGGIVTITNAEPGQVVAAGMVVARLARAEGRDVVVAVPEALVERVRVARASAELWSAQGRPVEATLRELSPTADPATRTFQARFRLPDALADIPIGLTATISLREPASERVARLPITAIFAQGAGAQVFVVDAATGRLTLRPVTITGYDGRHALVGSGLSEGDLVVAIGVQRLDPAVRVRVVETRGRGA